MCYLQKACQECSPPQALLPACPCIHLPLFLFSAGQTSWSIPHHPLPYDFLPQAVPHCPWVPFLLQSPSGALPHCSQKFQNKQEVPGTLCTPPSMGAASPHLCTMRFGWKVSRACLLTCFLLISTTLHTSLDLYQLSQYLVLTATCITPLAL